MPRHSLKLLFLLTAFAVAPATAGSRVGPTAGGHSQGPACPYERARLAALLSQGQAQQAPKAPTRITLLQGAPSESSLRNVAPGRFFTP
jgi:hypothetical protein